MGRLRVDQLESVECLAISRGSGQPRDDGNSNLVSLSSQVIIVRSPEKASNVGIGTPVLHVSWLPPLRTANPGKGHKWTAEQVAVFPQKQAKKRPSAQDARHCPVTGGLRGLQPSCSKRELSVDDEWHFENGRAATSKSMSAFLSRPLGFQSGPPKTLRVALCHVGPDPVWMQFGREPKGFTFGRAHRAPSDKRSPLRPRCWSVGPRCIATLESGRGH